MENLPGDSPIAIGGKLTSAQAAGVRAAASRVNPQTVQDCKTFGQEILDRGWYTKGDYQGQVTPDGRWRPYDFGSFGRLPPPGTPEYAQAVKSHWDAVNFEAETLQKLADKNAAAAVR